MRTSALIALGALVLAACGTSDGGVERPYSTCEGGCDLPGTLPELGVVALTDLLSCTSVIDVEAVDDFFANDQLECELARVPVEGASVSASVRVSNGTVFEEAFLVAGESARLGRLPRDGYPYDVTVNFRFGLPDDVASAYPTEVVLFDYSAFRDLEVEPMVLGIPAGLHRVKLWPDPELQAGWADSTIRAASVGGRFSVPVGDSTLEHTLRKATRPSSTALITFPDAMFFHVPAPLEGAGGGRITVSLYVRGGGEASAESSIDGPGYYVLDPTGRLTKTAIEELPLLPGYAGYGTPVPTAPDPEPEPVEIPDDPCGGACRSDEVCVEGGCVERRLQTQDAGACGLPSPSRCDPGEDGDCAELHVCVDSECRNLVCQRQPYPDCPPPAATCEEDADCYPDHACVDGRCHANLCG